MKSNALQEPIKLPLALTNGMYDNLSNLSKKREGEKFSVVSYRPKFIKWNMYSSLVRSSKLLIINE